MSGVVWSKFYWSDWESDPALKLCSLGAQGMWMRMLCVAAAHDPTGYVCIAGRPLGVTDLARMTGASETEAAALLAELDRNGVFARDRLGRIYSRRMVKDARVSAEARRNGRLGGNPSLRPSLGKDLGNPATLKGADKAPLKPHEPRARTRVEDPCGSSNPGLADATVRSPDRRTAASASKNASAAPMLGAGRPDGPAGLTASMPEANRGALWASLRAEAVGRHGEAFARAWLDPADWRPEERLVVCRLAIAAERLRRELRTELKALAVKVAALGEQPEAA